MEQHGEALYHQDDPDADSDVFIPDVKVGDLFSTNTSSGPLTDLDDVDDGYVQVPDTKRLKFEDPVLLDDISDIDLDVSDHPPKIRIPDPLSTSVESSDDSSSTSSSMIGAASSRSSSPISSPDIPSPFDDSPEFFGESYLPPNSNFSTGSIDSGGLLFPGSSISVVQAIAILLAWFAAFPMSKEAFSRLLYLMHTFLLPSGNALPASYDAALSMIGSFLLPVRDYHCCINDCVIFRNTGASLYQDLTECPVCNQPRYFPNTTIPRKRFKYIPPGQHLTRLYGNPVTSQLLQSHSTLQKMN